MGNMSESGQISVSSSSDDGSEDEFLTVEANMGGYNPTPESKSGITSLLKQLFRESSLDCESLASLCIEEKFGTFITEDLEDQEDDAAAMGCVVYGFTALFHFEQLKTAAAIKGLKEFLVRKIEENKKPEIHRLVDAITGGKTFFVVNEFMINMPATASLLSLETMLLETDFKRLAEKGTVAVILKMCKRFGESELTYLYDMDEVIGKFGVDNVDYPVNLEEFGTVLIPGENEDSKGEECPQYRRICFIPSSVFSTTLLEAMKAKVNEMNG